MNAFTQTYFFGNTALDPERQRKVQSMAAYRPSMKRKSTHWEIRCSGMTTK